MKSVKANVDTIILYEIWDQIKNRTWNGVMYEVWISTNTRLDHTKIIMALDINSSPVYND